MGAESDIEWTDATWNPTRGCTKISPGCKNCYAEAFAERFRGTDGHPYEDGFDPRMVPAQLALPLTWAKPRKVFVNSMSDLFMAEVADEYLEAVFGVMHAAGHHTFQVLTKRAERMRSFMASATAERCAAELCAGEYVDNGVFRSAGFRRDRLEHLPPGWAWPPRNVWLGVSVEDRKYGVPRIEHLRATPAAVRFLSVEPLLEDLGELDLTSIGWVIVGGESGNGARPLNIAWVRRIVAQARAQRVPVFVKQLGARPLDELGHTPLRIKHRKGAEPNEWPHDLRVQEFPEVRHA